jgi:hypothetical protein
MSKLIRTAKKLTVHVPATVLIVLAAAVAGCGDSPTAPATPPATTSTQQPAPVLAVFTDAATGFSTSDIRDVQDQIVRFDTANNRLIWAADGRSFSGYPVSGNFIGASRMFQVRFGTKNGEHRAYFTETGPATICDIEVIGILLMITPTTVKVPET